MSSKLLRNKFNLAHLYENQEETSEEGESALIQGNIPNWVQGTVFTTGPGKFHFESTVFTMVHHYDGYAILCKLEISGNKINMQKRYEQSDALKKANIVGMPVIPGAYTKSSPDTTKSAFGRLLSVLPDNTDNGNDNVYTFGNRVYTVCGSAYANEIHPSDLSTVTKIDFNKIGITGVTPHPLVDHDGRMYNCGGMVKSSGAKQVIVEIPAPKPGQNLKDCLKKFKIIATIPMNRNMYCNINHSFGMTKNYIILIEQPLLLNVKRMFGCIVTKTHTSFRDLLDWQPEESNRFTLIEKSSGKILKRKIIASETFFFHHVINCYEEKNHLVVDILAHPGIEAWDCSTLKNIIGGKCCENESAGVLKRFIIPLWVAEYSDEEKINNEPKESSTIGNIVRHGASWRIRDDSSLILTPGHISKSGLCMNATINPKYRFRNYRYTYSTSGFSMEGSYARKITKFDLDTNLELSWDCGGDYFFGEAIFIPNPQATKEDDGVLLAGVYNVHSDQNCFFVFICPQTMVEIARAEFYNQVPFYIHGTFVPTLF